MRKFGVFLINNYTFEATQLLYLMFRNTSKITHTNTLLPLLSSSTSSKEKADEKAHLFYIQWFITSDAIIKNIIKKQKQLILSTMLKKNKNHWTVLYIHLNYS